MTATTPTTSRSPLPVAEALLAFVSVATVAGMWRLFVDGSYLWPLVAHAVVAHAVVAVCRRQGMSMPVSAAVTVIAAALLITWMHLGDTTSLGLPTGRTLTAAGDRLEEAWRQFDEVKAPAPVLTGFLLAAAAALWVGAWLADVAAFRLWTSFEALIPSGTVFVFASLFSAERSRTTAAALWFGAALGFVLVHRTVRQHGSPSWIGSDPRLGTNALLRAGSALVAVSVVAAWIVGPRVPGADDSAILAVRDLDDDDGGSRRTVSPLVDIRSRLVDQSQVELFTVRTTQRAYWRLTALDDFDGTTWKSSGKFGEADGELDDVGDPPPNAEAVTQQFSISALSQIWLPAAFDPFRLDVEDDEEVRWHPESSTLIVPNDQPTSDGLRYQVVSAVPTNVTPDQLQGTGEPPEEIRELTTLPRGFPEPVIELARQVVAGAATPFEQAKALQDHFHNGSFEYSLDVQRGHSDSAIEDFLFVNRAGYCEQFAATYAAMARAVGLPSRVAVGFTPGVEDPSEPGLYRVSGEHAHAWPEVWIPEAGWIAFEPTPGRGAPYASSYTGLEESQDTPGLATDPMATPTSTVTNGTAATATTVPMPEVAPAFPDLPEPEPLPQFSLDEEDDEVPILRWLAWLILTAGALLVLALLVGIGIALSRATRRWRRWAAAATAEAKVRAAWADAVDAAGVLGAVPRRYDTPVEFARRAARAVGDTRFAPLAWIVAQADFSQESVDDEAADQAVELAKGVRHTVRHSTTTWTRLAAAADPRPPHRRHREGPRPTGPRIRISAEPDPT